MAGTSKDYSYLLTLRAGADDDLIAYIAPLPYGYRKTLILKALRAYLFSGVTLEDVMNELEFIESAMQTYMNSQACRTTLPASTTAVDASEELRNSLMEFGL